MVREGEDVQKKGWFSKSKSSTPPNASASRPPSATSVGQTLSSKDHAEDDGDLPPREEATPMTSTSTATSPPTPRTDKQLDDATGDAAELPARAGFDLAAMRAVVDGLEQGKGSRHDLTRPTRPETLPPPPSSAMSAQRPQSTSRLITKSPDLTPTSSAAHNPTRTAVSELRSASAEPRSFRDMDDALLPSGSEEDDRLPSSSPSPSDFPSRSRPTGDLALSPPGVYDGASWTPVSADKEAYGGGFGTPFGNPFHPTPFTAVGQTGSAPSNVSNPAAVPGVERDPWSFQTYSGDVSNSTGAKKPSSVFATNPWES